MTGIVKRISVFLAVIVIFFIWSFYGKEYCDLFEMAYNPNSGLIGNHCEIKIIKNVVIFLSFLAIFIDIAIFFIKRIYKKYSIKGITIICLTLVLIGGISCFLPNKNNQVKTLANNQIQNQSYNQHSQLNQDQEKTNKDTGQVHDSSINGWKTYTNKENGIEFDYPKEWIFEANQTGGGKDFLDIHLSLSSQHNNDYPLCDNFVGLEIQSNIAKDQNMDFFSFVKSQVVDGEMGPSGSLEEIKIDDHLGFKIDSSGWDSACTGPGYFIEQDKGHYIYIFTGSDNNHQKEGREKINQILSTFRFISTAQTPSQTCVPNWTCGWGPCVNGSQGQQAVDSNNCGLPSSGVDIACPALARTCQ
jgi:hypothetical protein